MANLQIYSQANKKPEQVAELLCSEGCNFTIALVVSNISVCQ